MSSGFHEDISHFLNTLDQLVFEKVVIQKIIRA